MKRTIPWPPVVVGGRLAMTEDPNGEPQDPDAALRQVIRLNLLDGSNANPWNGTIGTPDPTFRPASSATRARLEARVREVFRGLERTHRAKLSTVTFEPTNPSDPALLALRVVYVNLETGGRQSMEIARHA